MLVSSWVFTPHLLYSNPADRPMLMPSSDPTDGHPLGFGPSGFKTEKSSQGPCNETDPSIWEFRNSKNNWYGWVVAHGYSLLGFRLKYFFLNIANGSAKGWEWNQVVTKLLRGYMYTSWKLNLWLCGNLKSDQRFADFSKQVMLSKPAFLHMFDNISVDIRRAFRHSTTF